MVEKQTYNKKQSEKQSYKKQSVQIKRTRGTTWISHYAANLHIKGQKKKQK